MTVKKIKCKDCGDMYSPTRRTIEIKLNHKDIEALEDIIFTKLSKEEYWIKMKLVGKIWKQICEGEDKWEKEG